MRPSETPLITAEAIAVRVGEMARAIRGDLAALNPIVIAVMKGGMLFASDLARALNVPLRLDFVRAQSYTGHSASGPVRLTCMPELEVRGQHVLLVEDILDTGRTTRAIMDRLAEDAPGSLRLCVLLDKPDRRVVPVAADYTGFVIPGDFVVGYGLDYLEAYRALPGIHRLEPDA